MSSTKFKFKCWRPNDEPEEAAIEIEADYDKTAAEQFMDERIVGIEASGEENGILIRVCDPYGNIEDFQVHVTYEPVYSIQRFEQPF